MSREEGMKGGGDRRTVLDLVRASVVLEELFDGVFDSLDRLHFVAREKRAHQHSATPFRDHQKDAPSD